MIPQLRELEAKATPPQGDNYSNWRVFWKKEHAEHYIKTKLLSDDYRVVPVVLRADPRRKRPSTEER